MIMAGGVEFKDFSTEIKAEINEATIAWLHETANEIVSQAKRNCSESDFRVDLRDSYKSVVNNSKGEAVIGSPLEQAYWEEWGTGSYAAHKDGRKDWWVYVKGQDSKGASDSKHYKNREEAEEAAKYLRGKGLDAYATNGRKPHYTLEKAFEYVKPKAIQALETVLKKGLGG